jgi:hypothetical protein
LHADTAGLGLIRSCPWGPAARKLGPMSSTPSSPLSASHGSHAAAPARSARPESAQAPAAEPRAAFEEALARLQRRKGDAADEAVAADPALAAFSPPPGAIPAAGAESFVLAAVEAGAGSAGSAVGSSLGADELAGLLRSLHVPATADGPQRWEFHFGPDSQLVQGLTLTGQPGSTLTVHLHAQPQLSARERELSAQRLGELRQRLGERGSPVGALHWQDGAGSDREPDHQPGPRR